jgi:chorismate synthase
VNLDAVRLETTTTGEEHGRAGRILDLCDRDLAVEKRKGEIQKRKTGGSVRGRKKEKKEKKRRRGSRSTQFLHSL